MCWPVAELSRDVEFGGVGRPSAASLYTHRIGCVGCAPDWHRYAVTTVVAPCSYTNAGISRSRKISFPGQTPALFWWEGNFDILTGNSSAKLRNRSTTDIIALGITGSSRFHDCGGRDEVCVDERNDVIFIECLSVLACACETTPRHMLSC